MAKDYAILTFRIIKLPNWATGKSSRNRRSEGHGRAAPAAVARELWLVEQPQRNWVKAPVAGKLAGAGSKLVTLEEMKLS